jgi:hypothetical protein
MLQAEGVGVSMVIGRDGGVYKDRELDDEDDNLTTVLTSVDLPK